jgi:hypothetical protein
MQKSTQDDSSIADTSHTINQRSGIAAPAAPASDSPGVKFMADVAARAKLIYPDHGESRTVYVHEMAATEINRLTQVIGEKIITEASQNDLLRKYMQHVLDTEGVTFTDFLPSAVGGPNTVAFSEAEVAALTTLAGTLEA